MNRLTHGAVDALYSHEELAERRRHAAGYVPQPRSAISGVWRPVMTEQQKREFEQYVIDNQLPF